MENKSTLYLDILTIFKIAANAGMSRIEKHAFSEIYNRHLKRDCTTEEYNKYFQEYAAYIKLEEQFTSVIHNDPPIENDDVSYEDEVDDDTSYDSCDDDDDN